MVIISIKAILPQTTAFMQSSVFSVAISFLLFIIPFISSAENTQQEISSSSIERGLAVYKKSECAFCHGWAGDGQGHPRSPGAAANLRSSVLDKVVLTQIIRCGVPGGVMPYHDRLAYRDNRCGVEAGSLSEKQLPQQGKNIKPADMDALLAYIMSSVQGMGSVTFAQCEKYFKTGSRNCLYLQSNTAP